MSTGAAAHSADDLSATSTWAPLHQSAFRNLWIASFASNVGTWMQTVGAQWLLIERYTGPTLIALAQPATGAADRVIRDALPPAHMAQALEAALGHPVRHERTPLEAIGSADMRAMWEFLGRPRSPGRPAGTARCAPRDFLDPV
jgi:hypothetical protein